MSAGSSLVRSMLELHPVGQASLSSVLWSQSESLVCKSQLCQVFQRAASS